MNKMYTPGRQPRSAGSRLLRVPRHNLERYGRRGFSVTPAERPTGQSAPNKLSRTFKVQLKNTSF